MMIKYFISYSKLYELLQASPEATGFASAGGRGPVRLAFMA